MLQASFIILLTLCHVAGAGVELKCRSRDNDTETYSAKSQTDETGSYEITVDGDHQDDICEVNTVLSPDPTCVQQPPEISSARVTLAENTGMESNVRFANPIGFRGDKALPDCVNVLQDLDLNPEMI